MDLSSCAVKDISTCRPILAEAGFGLEYKCARMVPANQALPDALHLSGAGGCSAAEGRWNMAVLVAQRLLCIATQEGSSLDCKYCLGVCLKWLCCTRCSYSAGLVNRDVCGTAGCMQCLTIINIAIKLQRSVDALLDHALHPVASKHFDCNDACVL